MKLILTVVAALAVAVGLALLSLEDPGYVVLAREPYVVRLPLLLFILLAGIVFVLGYLLLGFVGSLLRAPRNYRRWRAAGHEKNVRRHTTRGYAGLVEGDWRTAERSLTAKLEHNQAPLVNSLGAAWAAHQQNAPERRDRYLDQALAQHPEHRLAIGLTRARLLVQGGDLAAAREPLEALHRQSPDNAPTVRLLADIYRDLGDVQAEVSLLPALHRLGVFAAEEMRERERVAFTRLAAIPAGADGGDTPADGFERLPAARRRDPVVVAGYAGELIRRGDANGAEKVLRRALNRRFDNELIYLYGLVRSDYLEYQLQLVRSFEKAHGGNPDLLFTLARLHRFAGERETSRGYFERAIEAGARPEVFVDFSALLKEMGETEAALVLLRQGVDALDPGLRPAAAAASGELVVLGDGPARGGG